MGAESDHTKSEDESRCISTAANNKPDVTMRCRFFFHSGVHCRSGSACKFSHESNGLTDGQALKTIQCPFFLRGECHFGDFCELSHETIEEKTKDKDSEAMCSICFEVVKSKKQKFGLLSCCDHVYCFQCLMQWRNEGFGECTSRRVCPTCRKKSDYVVPSSVLPANDQEKETILQEYKENLRTVPCKHFDGTIGSCLFGKDCFYAHRSQNGTDVKSRDKSMQQLYEERQANREERMDHDLDDIADMLVMMGLQRLRNGRGRAQRSRGDEDDESDEDDFLSPIADYIASLLGEGGSMTS